jgi:GntR family transcriptional regulator
VLIRDAVPLYHQLRELLSEKIESGEWQPGKQLPSEPDLAREFGVSRATVRQAMQLLEQQGLVERIQGKGTFVGRPKFANNLMFMFSASRGITNNKALPDLQVMHLERVHPSPTVAARLGIGVEDEVFELKRRVVVDGEPLLLVRSWLIASRFPGLDEKFPKEGSVLGTLLTHYGLEGMAQHKEVEVTILDEGEAEDLSARPGAPALLLTYLTRPLEGEPFEYREVVVRGDRCKYYVDQEQAEFLI